MSVAKFSVALDGVAETLLWPLYNRACEARKREGLLHDPEAVRIADAIDYPYEAKFGPPGLDHVQRALCFDDQIRRYIRQHPYATVVALGDGLETSFKRVDNGHLRWVAVDLPESIALRRRFLPDTERHRNLACSALDFRWMDTLEGLRGVIVTAQGLLMYFESASVRELIRRCAERFSGGWLLFDTISRSYSRNTLQGAQKTRNYRLPAMPWGIDADQLQDIATFHSNIVEVKELDPTFGLDWRSNLRHVARKHSGRLGTDRCCFVRLRFGAGM